MTIFISTIAHQSGFSTTSQASPQGIVRDLPTQSSIKDKVGSFKHALFAPGRFTQRPIIGDNATGQARYIGESQLLRDKGAALDAPDEREQQYELLKGAKQET